MVERGRGVKDTVELIEVGNETLNSVRGDHRNAVIESPQPRAIGAASSEGYHREVVIDKQSFA